MDIINGSFKVCNSILFILFFLNFSCTQKYDKEIGLYKLEKRGYYFLPIDSVTSVNNSDIFYYENNKDHLLYLLNKTKKYIQIYNFLSKKIVKKITIEKEGPNGVGDVGSIYVKNRDSIYMLSGYDYKLSLINDKGVVINRFKLLHEDSKYDTITMAVPTGAYSVLCAGDDINPIYEYNNKIIIGAYPNLDYDKEIYFSKGKTGICLDIYTKKFNYILNIPESHIRRFRDGYRFPGQFTWSSLTFNKYKNVSVTSYPADENLYVTDMVTYKTKPYLAKSKYFERVNLLRKIPRSPQESFNFVKNNHFYEGVYYDHYRKIYLRYVFHPNKKKRNEFDSHPWFILSVILFDEDFKKMGESELEENLPGGTIFFRNDGIYMQKYNPNTEDKLTFVKYGISKN